MNQADIKHYSMNIQWEPQDNIYTDPQRLWGELRRI